MAPRKQIHPSRQRDDTMRDAGERAQILEASLHASARAAREEAAPKLKRMVDMSIPLWGILTAIGGFALLMVNLYISVQGLTTAMTDVQLTLKAGNNLANSNAIEIATIKIRLENSERTYRDLQQQVSLNQQSIRAGAGR